MIDNDVVAKGLADLASRILSFGAKTEKLNTGLPRV